MTGSVGDGGWDLGDDLGDDFSVIDFEAFAAWDF